MRAASKPMALAFVFEFPQLLENSDPKLEIA